MNALNLILVCGLAAALPQGTHIVGNAEIASRTLDYRDFTKLKVRGPLRVEIENADHFNVELVAESNILPLVKSSVDDGELLVEVEGTFETKHDIEVHVKMPKLEAIVQDGYVRTTLGKFAADRFTVEAQGHSKLTGVVTVNMLTILANGSTTIDLSKSTLDQVTLRVQGSNEIQLSHVTELTGSVTGNSSVRYQGTPTKLAVRAVGNSKIGPK